MFTGFSVRVTITWCALTTLLLSFVVLGNGIQDITYDDTSIFYLSLHRGCFGANQKEWFYPGTGKHSEVGRGGGSGCNLNIAFGKGGIGNTHYAAAFTEAVLPVLSSFQPDLIICAAGFDAADGDLLGDCCLSPSMYYIMTKSLFETCGSDIPLVMALEGGYNLVRPVVYQILGCTQHIHLYHPVYSPRQILSRCTGRNFEMFRSNRIGDA